MNEVNVKFSFLEDVCNTNSTNWSQFFASWTIFLYFGLNNSKMMKLFTDFSSSPYRYGITNYDTLYYESHTSVKFPWNKPPIEEQNWFPLTSGCNLTIPTRLIKWKAFMNFWLHTCFNNDIFVIKKERLGLVFKLITTNPLYYKNIKNFNGFGFLEPITATNSRKLLKLKRQYPFLYTSKMLNDSKSFYFIFGPASIFQHSIFPKLNISHIDLYHLKEIYSNVKLKRGSEIKLVRKFIDIGLFKHINEDLLPYINNNSSICDDDVIEIGNMRCTIGTLKNNFRSITINNVDDIV